MSESTSQAAKRQKMMDEEEQRQNQMEIAGPSREIEVGGPSKEIDVAGPSNEISTFRFLDLPEDCMLELFEYLSLKQLYSLGRTSKLMQARAGQYFKQHFKTSPKMTFDNGIYTAYSDHKSVTNEFIQTSGFNQYITFTTNYNQIAPLGYLQRHTNKFQSMQHLTLDDILLDTIQEENLQNLLAKLESVCLTRCTMWETLGDFHTTFLQYCTKLKHLRVFHDQEEILREMPNPWLLREYPNLETLHLETLGSIQVNELSGFLERNANIRDFRTNARFLWANRHELLNSKVKLDHLYIRHGDMFVESVQNLYQLLNQLHEQGFHKRLHFHISRFKQEHSDQLKSLNGLERLTIDCVLNAILDIPPLVNLKQLSIHWSIPSKYIEILATNLVNLEYFQADKMSRKDISTIISRMPKLKKFHVTPYEGTLNLSKLDAQRAALVEACKVTIFVPQKVYMATKWTLQNGQIYFDSVDMKRNSADTFGWMIDGRIID